MSSSNARGPTPAPAFTVPRSGNGCRASMQMLNGYLNWLSSKMDFAPEALNRSVTRAQNNQVVLRLSDAWPMRKLRISTTRYCAPDRTFLRSADENLARVLRRAAKIDNARARQCQSGTASYASGALRGYGRSMYAASSGPDENSN